VRELVNRVDWPWARQERGCKISAREDGARPTEKEANWVPERECEREFRHERMIAHLPKD
jgi:hypothetical protein